MIPFNLNEFLRFYMLLHTWCPAPTPSTKRTYVQLGKEEHFCAISYQGGCKRFLNLTWHFCAYRGTLTKNCYFRQHCKHFPKAFSHCVRPCLCQFILMLFVDVSTITKVNGNYNNHNDFIHKSVSVRHFYLNKKYAIFVTVTTDSHVFS